VTKTMESFGFLVESNGSILLNLFQIIVHLTFFYLKFDHLSYSKICAKYHFFLL
jgi:hypothetical protein